MLAPRRLPLSSNLTLNALAFVGLLQAEGHELPLALRERFAPYDSVRLVL